jgi:hypothetical protein
MKMQTEVVKSCEKTGERGTIKILSSLKNRKSGRLPRTVQADDDAVRQFRHGSLKSLP